MKTRINFHLLVALSLPFAMALFLAALTSQVASGTQIPLSNTLVSVPNSFLFRPFQSNDYEITSYFDHSCPNYSGENPSQAQNITIFSGHTLSDSCVSYNIDGSLAAGCTGRIKSFVNTAWESPRLYYSGHDGYDFYTSGNVLAAAKGIVSFVGEKSSCGWMIEIVHDGDGSGFKTQYCHLVTQSNVPYGIQQGVVVNTGDPIGVIDNTGSSSGTHLHFSVQRYTTTGYQSTDPFGWDTSVSLEDPLVILVKVEN